MAFSVENTDDLTGINSAKIIEMYPEVAETILLGLENNEKMIFISEYGLTKEQTFEIYKAVLFENPQVFYVLSTTIKYYRYIEDGPIAAIGPTYIFTQDERAEATEKFNKATSYFLSGVEDSWSDLEKATYLHDKLITQCEYDTSTTDYPPIDRTAYGSLVNNVTVCQGFSLGYNYLLSKVGIDAYYVINSAQNHGWSLIELDGNYYHVDLTWDDPTYDLIGRLRRTYFLMSDKALKTLRPEESWTYDLKATDTSYDDAWWKNLKAPSYVVDGYEYYIDPDYICYNGGFGAIRRYDKTTGKHNLVYQIGGVWFTDSQMTQYWSGNYSGFAYDGKVFYFNTPDKVYSIKPDGTKLVQHYQKPSTIVDNIFGLSFQTDGNLYVEHRPTTATDGEIYQVSIKSSNTENTEPTTEPKTEPNSSEPTSDTNPTQPIYRLGDINGDGAVSIRDATYLQLYVAKSITLDSTIVAMSDFNFDGVVDINDVTTLQKQLVS